MNIALVMAGENVFGRIIAAALQRHSPVIFHETRTKRAGRLMNWLPNLPAPPLNGNLIEVVDLKSTEVGKQLSAFDYVINGGVGFIFGRDYLALPRLVF